MTDKKIRPPRRSEETPSDDTSLELKQQRDAFVHTFFKKGAEFTEELLKENERLRHQTVKLEQENASLRMQLKSDEAVRDLLRKIDQLEKEKDALLSQFSQQEAVTTRFTNRYSEIEELANLANLYVASYQLHSTMRLPLVVRHLRELLAQLVGARASAIYVADEKRRQLVPIASDGIDRDSLPRVQVVDGGEPPQGAASVIERVFLTGVASINEGDLMEASMTSPAACLPLHIDDRVVGVIVLYEVLPQKDRFVNVDYELFKMLGAHAATALAGAMLLSESDGKIPGLDVFRDLDEGPKMAPRSVAPPRPGTKP